MLFAAWVCLLPDVHPFFVGMAQTLDRTIARLERRLNSLNAEAVRLQVAVAAECRPAEKRAEQIKLTAYREQIADYQATLTQCRSQFEAQVTRRWAVPEIAQAKRLAGSSSGELVGAA